MKIWTASLLFCVGCVCCGQKPERKNILYIVVDDLRPQLGAYGQGYMHTPNIDALANRSLVFDRAYCQFSFCAPSRNSFMTGRRPDKTKCWNFIDHFREVGKDWISMPQYFKEHGYFSTGVGKLYHPNLPPKGDPPSWSDFDDFPYINPSPLGCPNNTAWCSIDPQKYNFSDIETLNIALQRLQYAAKNKSRPFFLGVGFHKPHLPFRSPTEFIGNYPPAEEIAIATDKDFPKNTPTIAWNNCLAGGHRYKDVTENRDYLTPMSDSEAHQLRRGYYAAVSFTDSLVGQLLTTLKELDLDDETIVSFHADHGWQLGEHNMWCKMSNFELGVRVPLMIHVPWKPSSAGKRTQALAELVDMYPTLAELAGLPPPEDVDGTSQAPVFEETSSSVKNASFSQFPKCGTNMTDLSTCLRTDKHKIDYMGYSIRTDRYRYTEWLRWDGTSLKADWSETVATELYDHQGDTEENFNSFENENMASQSPDLAQQLSKQLRAAMMKQ